ncbi:MAG: hypothetical protein RSA01_04700 [Clostridium sp.]
MKKYIKRKNSSNENIHLKYEDDIYLVKVIFSHDINCIDPLYTLIINHKKTGKIETYTLGNFSPVRSHNELNRIEVNSSTLRILPKIINTNVYNQDEKYLKGYAFCL